MIQSNYYDAVRQRPDMCDAQPTGLGRIDDPKLSSRALPQAMQYLEKELSYLGESLNELRNRLNPLMRPEPPQPTCEQKQSPSTVPMVQELERYAGVVNAFANQVRDLVERLEI
jgi:hypothetical protein